ncbi:MAG: LPS export ABC transporter periplasmic protein LptC [Alphaproteobacteria bacterium]|nr:LPS export ABC transporter periplasmic protein LptC [Alphaproteobacteria bacterium]
MRRKAAAAMPGASQSPALKNPEISAELRNDRHSRRVGRLKLVLPGIGFGLLLLVALWPQLGPLLASVRGAFPAIDLRDARELRMLAPRYAGTDRLDRPYVVTAAVGRQIPDREDLMSLEQPRAELRLHNGTAVVTAMTGIYQAQTQLLDLFDDVNLVQQDGTRFVTKSAHLDVANNAGEGLDAVQGHGPSGDLAAQGFRIRDRGNTIIFTGESRVLLNSAHGSGEPARPPTVPTEVAQAAARAEAESPTNKSAAPPAKTAKSAAASAPKPVNPAPAKAQPKLAAAASTVAKAPAHGRSVPAAAAKPTPKKES